MVSLRMRTLGKMAHEDKIRYIKQIDLDDIIPDPSQPRKEFDDAKIAEMSANLIKRGQLQPILVRENPEGSPPFLVFDGEYRWRSAMVERKPAQLDAIVYAGDVDPDAILESQFLINDMRTDMSFADRAAFFKSRKERYGSVEAVAEQMGIEPRRIWRVLQAADAGGLAGQVRDERLTRDAETINAIESLERQNPAAAEQLVKEGKEKGRITRTAVSDALRVSKAKNDVKGTGTSEGKGTNTGKAAPDTNNPATSTKAKSQAASSAPSIKTPLRLLVRWEPGTSKKDADFAKRWKTLEGKGGEAFLVIDKAPAPGFAWVAFGSAETITEFPLSGLRIERIAVAE